MPSPLRRDVPAADPGRVVVPHTDHVRGFVFDVATGKLYEVV